MTMIWDYKWTLDLGLHVYVPRNRYDSPHGSPESLNAARMAASRLNATMIDATLIAEAEDAGFRPADPVTSDGVNWSFDVTGSAKTALMTCFL